MDGCAATARTMAQAMRWVNESFSERPAVFNWSLICRRWASRTATEIVRKLVAVGIDRLSSM